MEPFLKYDRDGAVVIARFNRPDERNAITESRHAEEIAAFCDEMTGDRSVKSIVLTGEGKAFCAGGNIKLMQDRAGMFEGSPWQIRNAYRAGVHRIGPALFGLEVPVVAAINGPAIGLGLDIACMCDIRLMADTAVVAESYVKLGIVPGGGGSWLLPRLIGPQRAALMTLTGEQINAATALQYGLVAEVLAPDALMGRAIEIAARMAANPGHATRLAKRLMRDSLGLTFDTHLQMAAAFQSISHHTEDHREAVSAFLAKREPSFANQ